MIKRTVAIDNPARLSLKNSQLIIEMEGAVAGVIPVEDIGVLIVDHPTVTYTHRCISAMIENNTAVIICGANHHPTGIFLPLDGNDLQGERFRVQIDAAVPLKKRLWMQTVQAKVLSQAALLSGINKEGARLERLAKSVRAGDPKNVEAQAARHYWPMLFGKDFRRSRQGLPPNNLLNYGYMVLRAAVARALVSSGLLPTFGIHHRNRYNAYALADDIMEPYRVYVDRAVLDIYRESNELTKETKKCLLDVLACEVRFGEVKSPLMVGLHKTTASLQRCLAGEEKAIIYPNL